MYRPLYYVNSFSGNLYSRWAETWSRKGIVKETRKYSLVFWTGWFVKSMWQVFVMLASDMSTFSASFFTLLYQFSWFSIVNLGLWIKSIDWATSRSFARRFTGYWQEIIKNTESWNQGENEFKSISKFKQWLFFGWSFIIAMDSIISFFHYKWKIVWHKKLFKNIHDLYYLNPSSSAGISKFMAQGFWAIQQYFDFKTVFTWSWQIKKIRDFFNISHQFSNTLFSTRSY